MWGIFMQRANIIVHGRVQGVFFRAYAKEKAELRGLRGFARNLPDSSVEIVVEGDETSIREFIDDLEEKGYNLPVGNLRVRGDYQPVVKIKGEDLARHIGVYAITGKGKTGFTKVLLHKIAEETEGRYGALVYDAHDEYYKTIQPLLVGMKEARLKSIIYYDLHSPRVPKVALTSITPQDFRKSSPSIDVMIAHKSVIKRIFEAVVQGNREQARLFLNYSGS